MKKNDIEQNTELSNSKSCNNLERYIVPIWHKTTLSFTEAALLTGIGETRLRSIADRHQELVVIINRNRRFKRKSLEEWILNSSFI